MTQKTSTKNALFERGGGGQIAIQAMPFWTGFLAALAALGLPWLLRDHWYCKMFNKIKTIGLRHCSRGMSEEKNSKKIKVAEPADQYLGVW